MNDDAALAEFEDSLRRSFKWQIHTVGERIFAIQHVLRFGVPVVRLSVELKLGKPISISMYGQQLPKAHRVWREGDVYRLLSTNVTRSYDETYNFIAKLNSDFCDCVGIEIPQELQEAVNDSMQIKLESDRVSASVCSLTGLVVRGNIVQSQNCDLIISKRGQRRPGQSCIACTQAAKDVTSVLKYVPMTMVSVPSSSSPSSSSAENVETIRRSTNIVEDLRTKLHEKRKRVATLSAQNSRLQHRLKRESLIPATTKLIAACRQLRRENDSSISPSLLLFIEQQLKAASTANARGMRWDSEILQLASSVKRISAVAYEALYDSGFVKLPHPSTLKKFAKATDKEEEFVQSDS